MSRLRIAAAFGAAACVIAPLGLSQVQAQGPSRTRDLPSDARPGECYGKVTLPAVYGSSKRQVLVKQGWTETRRVPARIEKIPHKVLVRPASVEKVRKAPVYRTHVSWIERPGKVRRVSEPARYEIIREKVLVEPAHAEWRSVDAPLAYGETASRQTLIHATGEVVCRVWVPARYDYIERKVLLSRERTYELVGEPRRERVVRKVLVSQGGWVERRRPAVYRTEYTRREVRPARTALVEHKPVYRTVETPTLVRAEREGWARVLCGGEINPTFLARVQEALIDKGFDPGAPDGVGRPETYAALRAYQRQKGLAQGQLTEETARALGVM